MTAGLAGGAERRAAELEGGRERPGKARAAAWLLPMQLLPAQMRARLLPMPLPHLPAVRLNLNVAHAAAAAGGCVIADATKRGKVRLRAV